MRRTRRLFSVNERGSLMPSHGRVTFGIPHGHVDDE
jgi:hypothetical protein